MVSIGAHPGGSQIQNDSSRGRISRFDGQAVVASACRSVRSNHITQSLGHFASELARVMLSLSLGLVFVQLTMPTRNGASRTHFGTRSAAAHGDDVAAIVMPASDSSVSGSSQTLAHFLYPGGPAPTTPKRDRVPEPCSASSG